MEVNQKGLLVCLITGLLAAGSAHASAPSFVTFTNETSLALGTSIAGLPGYGIDPLVTKTLSYNIVNIGCNYNNVADNCPIDFLDKQTGSKVATVYINASTGTLNAQPTFYGEYASQYEVMGWEQSPISHITIAKKI